MPRLPLIGQPYSGKSGIASAQRSVNLYGESNKDDPQAASPVTWYPTPGTILFATPGNPGKARCTYRTSIGTAYEVVGSFVYFVSANGNLNFVGTIPNDASQVYMADNGLVAVLVNGKTGQGWAIDLVSNAFGAIIDPSFYGADFCLFLDTFFIFNRPATNQFYISLGMVTFALLTTGTSFDPLDIAAKAGSADPIVGLATTHDELLLIGALTTEVWIGTGAADFFFQRVQGAYIDHGCASPYSIASQDVVTLWIMRDRQGRFIVVKCVGYEVTEVSTPRIVKEFSSYADISDAIGFCYQINDHAFYQLVFPTANKTWTLDLTTGWWNELVYLDENGNENRHRANCCMFAFDKILMGDFETGKIYELNKDTYTDDGNQIVRIRIFMHLVGSEYERRIYNSLDADMEVATVTDEDNIGNPKISLSWSDDKGRTFGFPVEQSMGKEGETLTTISWNRLGMARDRVFKLQWNAAIETALNGIFLTSKSART